MSKRARSATTATSLGGTVASFMTFPEHGIVVAVTSNISYADTPTLALKIAQAFALYHQREAALVVGLGRVRLPGVVGTSDRGARGSSGPVASPHRRHASLFRDRAVNHLRRHHQCRGGARVIVALWLLAIQGVIGTFDTLLPRVAIRLPARGAQAASELELHAGRDFLYAVLSARFPAGVARGRGCWSSLAVLIAEIVLTLTDFVVEISARKGSGRRVRRRTHHSCRDGHLVRSHDREPDSGLACVVAAAQRTRQRTA